MTYYLDGNGYQRDEQTGKLIHRQMCKEAHGDFPAKWDVHHIDYNKLNNDPENLIALPVPVHIQAHRRKVFTRQGCEILLAQYEKLRDAYVEARRDFDKAFPVKDWETLKEKRVESRLKAKKAQQKLKNKKGKKNKRVWFYTSSKDIPKPKKNDSYAQFLVGNYPADLELSTSPSYKYRWIRKDGSYFAHARECDGDEFIKAVARGESKQDAARRIWFSHPKRVKEVEKAREMMKNDSSRVSQRAPQNP